jgi:hypothetical protein
MRTARNVEISLALAAQSEYTFASRVEAREELEVSMTYFVSIACTSSREASPG